MTSSNSASPMLRKLGNIILVFVVLTIIGLAVLAFKYPDNFREYRLYLTQDRPALLLDFDQISERWTEKQVIQEFPQLVFQCSDFGTDRNSNSRNCYADIASHNAIPAMGINFFFENGRVHRVGISIPWWAHNVTANKLNEQYGQALLVTLDHEQNERVDIRKLPAGGAILYNHERSANPIDWSYVLWYSERACRDEHCSKMVDSAQ